MLSLIFQCSRNCWQICFRWDKHKMQNVAETLVIFLPLALPFALSLSLHLLDVCVCVLDDATRRQWQSTRKANRRATATAAAVDIIDAKWKGNELMRRKRRRRTEKKKLSRFCESRYCRRLFWENRWKTFLCVRIILGYGGICLLVYSY